MTEAAIVALLTLLTEVVKDAPEIISEIESIVAAAKGRPIAPSVAAQVAEAKKALGA